MAVGLAGVGRFQPSEMILTRRSVDGLADLAAQGFQVQTDNRDAARRAEVVVVAVQPGQLDILLHEIAPDLDPLATCSSRSCRAPASRTSSARSAARSRWCAPCPTRRSP